MLITAIGGEFRTQLLASASLVRLASVDLAAAAKRRSSDDAAHADGRGASRHVQNDLLPTRFSSPDQPQSDRRCIEPEQGCATARHTIVHVVKPALRRCEVVPSTNGAAIADTKSDAVRRLQKRTTASPEVGRSPLNLRGKAGRASTARRPSRMLTSADKIARPSRIYSTVRRRERPASSSSTTTDWPETASPSRRQTSSSRQRA